MCPGPRVAGALGAVHQQHAIVGIEDHRDRGAAAPDADAAASHGGAVSLVERRTASRSTSVDTAV